MHGTNWSLLLNDGFLSGSPSSPEVRQSVLLQHAKQTTGDVQRKRLGQLMLCDVILYDSETHHTVVWAVSKRCTVAAFTAVLGHQIFLSLKKSSAVQVIKCSHANDTDYFTNCSGALVSCWDKCLNGGGNYVEKQSACQCICAFTKLIHSITCSVTVAVSDFQNNLYS